MASSGYTDRVIKIWSVSTGQTKREIRTNITYLNSLKLLNNKIHLAVSGYPSDIQIYNVNNGNLVSTLRGHTNDVWNFIQLSNSDLLASACADATVRIWNLTSNTCKFILEGHTYPVFGLKQISSQVLASGSANGVIKLWNATDGQLIRTLTNLDRDYIELFPLDLLKEKETTSSSKLVSLSMEQIINVWNWTTGDLLSTIRAEGSAMHTLVVINISGISSMNQKTSKIRFMLFQFVSILHLVQQYIRFCPRDVIVSVTVHGRS